MEQLFRDIEKWHEDRLLNVAEAQLVKVMEEVGELAKELAHGAKDEVAIMDAIGDSMIALIGVANVLGLESWKCLEYAWVLVKNRTGKTTNGHFIKDGDE